MAHILRNSKQFSSFRNSSLLENDICSKPCTTCSLVLVAWATTAHFWCCKWVQQKTHLRDNSSLYGIRQPWRCREIDCLLASLPVYIGNLVHNCPPQKWHHSPTHKHKWHWVEKLTLQGQIIPLLLVQSFCDFSCCNYAQLAVIQTSSPVQWWEVHCYHI